METIWAILLLTVASTAQATSDAQLGPVLQAKPTEQDFIVTAADWARPRSGEYVVQLPAVRGAMQALDRVAGSFLLIRFPGGEDGTLMAHELKDWLVALGLALSVVVTDASRVRWIPPLTASFLAFFGIGVASTLSRKSP
mgnify:CR=1 FL=1